MHLNIRAAALRALAGIGVWTLTLGVACGASDEPSPQSGASLTGLPTPFASDKSPTLAKGAKSAPQSTPMQTRTTALPTLVSWVFEWETPLHRAAYDGEPAVVEELLNKGESVSATAKIRHPNEGITFNLVTPLHLAAMNNGSTVVALLLDREADVNAKSKYALLLDREADDLVIPLCTWRLWL